MHIAKHDHLLAFMKQARLQKTATTACGKQIAVSKIATNGEQISCPACRQVITDGMKEVREVYAQHPDIFGELPAAFI